MLNRRAWFRSAAGSGAALALAPRLLQALEPVLSPLQGTLLKKAIPATGELLPVIGLGSSATFASVARSEEVSALKEVFRAMVDRGATLFDTAPSYGVSEQVAGQIVNELGIADKMFWATKLNAAGRGAGATTDPAAARAPPTKKPPIGPPPPGRAGSRAGAADASARNPNLGTP